MIAMGWFWLVFIAGGIWQALRLTGNVSGLRGTASLRERGNRL